MLINLLTISNCNKHFRKRFYLVISKTGFNDLLLLLSDPPQVSIQLGRSLVASDIREGVDVYFDCLVSANPLPKSKLVTWLHNVSTVSSL